MEQPQQNLGPVPPAPSLGGAPSPMYASALHRSVEDIHNLLGAWNEFLSLFRPEYFTTADGRRLEALVRTKYKKVANTRYFGITDVSTEDTPKIHVNAGILEGPDVAGIDSDPPEIASYMKDIDVAGGDFTVANGYKVWVKITASVTEAEFEYNNENSEDDLADLLTVTTIIKSKTWAATAGQVEVGADIPAATATTAYRLLADITIIDGVMTILPRRDGAISVPFITGASGDDVEVTGETDDIDVCEDGVAVTKRFVAKTID